MNENIIRACDMIKEATNTWVLSGAGISTESGIPDFRSPKVGLWNKIDPMEALSTEVLYNNPKKFYDIGYKLLLGMEDVEPNKGHLALAEMEKLGFIKGIITQNIDGLHQKGGSKNVLEIHGHIRTGRCINCGKVVKLSVLTEKVNKNQIPPKCDKCNGMLRPDVVMFGDNLPEDFNIAWENSKTADLMIVVGSSLTVAPANYLPQMASKVIIINIGETPMDKHADLVIRDKIGNVLTKILDKLKKGE
ncbi:SIR2 family NAD-dependent protein deacylase [Caldisalinibacter kiritimatiensis]|uniref:protein acetyllysine N-acetyltransferase n=1 Tax=Caldisalinibacter kiritimatiensis TaxID=1304284 RepID=R1CF27_9FIRM|nr:NAD-dependent protein deacylase [Caldisalinibacter kiritimatiensis]EOD00905.1 NAD-dependent protein deacetylase of SIR2 family [Caldisalinibacter kiritimatiensis]